MSAFNVLDNIFTGSLKGTLMGPVVASQQYDPQLFTYMQVYEWEVHNGFTLDTPGEFGLFFEVMQMNINKSKLRVRIAPGYPTAPVFERVCTAEYAVDAAVISSIVCRQVVPIDTAAEKGSNVWESAVTPIDGTHGLLTTRYDPVIFQQQSISISRPDVLPDRFKALRKEIETSINVPGKIGKPLLNVGDTFRSEEQISPILKRVVAREQDNTTDLQLDGKINYVERDRVNVIETLETSLVPADFGLDIVDSKVSDLGTGEWIKETIRNPAAWSLHKGSKVDAELNASIGYTEQFVTPPAVTTNEANVEYDPINVHRSLKRVLTIPANVLDSLIHSFPQNANLQLPRVLKSINVIWNAASEAGDQTSGWSGSSSGESYALSCNLSDGSSASCAAIPEIIVEIQDIWSSNLPCTGYVFYMKNPVTLPQILARLGCQKWPVFHPQSHTLVGLGTKVGCSVRVGISASSSGSPSSSSKDGGFTASSQVDLSLTNNVIQIPSTIHGAIAVGGELAKTVSAGASGFITVAGTNFPSVTAQQSKAINAAGLVYPQYLPPTPGRNSIPTAGNYLIDSQVSPYKWGYCKVYAQVFDASVLST